MSGAPRRWIRLDVCWEDSPWLDALDGTAAGCWPRLLCHFKQNGVAGSMKAASTAVLARRWRVPTTAVESLISAAIQDGAMAIVGDDWTLPNWAKYQEPDSTNRLRQQAYRDRKRTGKKWSHGLGCEACGGKKDLTRDHIIPHSHGGTDDPSNIRVLCRSCNSSRRANLEWQGPDNALPAVMGRDPAVTRHATETLTLTETLTPTSTATSDRSRKKRASPTYTPEFLELWAIHRRGSKAEAFQAYQHATVRHAQMAEALTHYVREKVKPGFEGAHLFRWLRDERWDEYENGNGNGRSGNFATDADYEPGGIYYREPRNG